MRKITSLSFLVFFTVSIFIYSCKKEDATPTPTPNTPSCSYLLVQDSSVYSGSSGSGVRKMAYKYNAGKKLVKIEYSIPPNTTYDSFDTIIYSNNLVSIVEKYSIANLYETDTYYYTGSVLDSVHEVDIVSPFDRTISFTYTAGKLSAINTVYYIGTSGGGPENIDQIVFAANGNITSVNLMDVPSGYGATTIITDITAPNPFYGLNIYDLNNDENAFLNMFNPNNATSAYPTIFPGNPFFTNTYTYLSGRVAIITNINYNNGVDTTISTLSYQCF